jgi:heme exporter protein CcmD
MSAHAWFILASYAIAALAIGGAALAIVLDHRALKHALAKLPSSPDEEARK